MSAVREGRGLAFSRASGISGLEFFKFIPSLFFYKAGRL